MTLRIRYFASLRERRGVSTEEVQSRSTTPGELYRELDQRFGLGMDPAVVRFAVDGEFVSAGADLVEGSEVALIPPVAGG